MALSRGRPPKSIEQRLKDGTYNPRVHGPIDATLFWTGEKLPEDPPTSLTTWGAKVWVRLYKVVSENGLITATDREVFAAYCDAVGEWEQAQYEIARSGGMFPVKAPKRPRTAAELTPPTLEEQATQNKWNKVKQQAFVNMYQLARVLGLTPSDRDKIVRVKDPKQKEAEQKPGTIPMSRPQTALDRLNTVG